MPGQSPVRVLHVIDSLAGGGSERWVWEIVRRASERVTHRVVTVLPDRGRFAYSRRLAELGAYGGSSARNSTRSKPGEQRTVSWASVVGSKLPQSVRRKIMPCWHYGVVLPGAMSRIMREFIAARPDVIHTHTFHGFVYGLLLGVTTRRPTIHTVPSLVVQMTDAGYGWMPQLYRRCGHRISRFFTAYPEELLKLGIPSAKVVRILGGVDLETAVSALRSRDECRRSVREVLRIPMDAPVILSVGRLHPSKGHRFMLASLPRILERIPDAHWVVLGEGAERAALMARGRELGIGDRIHLVGFVEDPSSWYVAADVYVRTAVFEGENLSSYQAMAAAVPVVAFDTRCETDLVRVVGHGILVPLGDCTALGDAVVRVLTSPGVRRRLGERGLAYASAHLDIRVIVRLFEEAYLELGTSLVGGVPATPRIS